MKTFRCLGFVSMLALCLATIAPAQMSGTYTIDPGGGGLRNFKTFTAAATELVLQGVDGPVLLSVADGTFTEFWRFTRVNGASATNTITIRSRNRGKAKMKIDNRDRVVVSGSWFVVDGLEFEYDFPNTAIEGAFMTGSNIECRNCIFTNTFLKTNGHRFRIHHNLFTTRFASSLVCEMSNGTLIHHNEFRMVESSREVLVIRPYSTPAERVRIYNNLIWGSKRGSYCFHAGNLVDFTHNTVVALPSSQSSLFWLFAIDGSPHAPANVSNNIFVNLNLGNLMLVQTRVNSPAYFRLSNNLYWAAKPANWFTLDVTGSQHFRSLADWQKVTGQEVGSKFRDPEFFDLASRPANLDLRGTSPAILAAAGTPAYVTDDFAGNPRKTPSSIGAYEGKPAPSFVTYGLGCPGTFGNVPAIGYRGDLKLGSTNFEVTLSNALGGSGVPVFFAVGAAKTTRNLGGSCDLLVRPDIVVGLTMGGTSGPGNGAASVKIALPSDLRLRGAQAHLQWGNADPASAGLGVALSNGATLTL